MAKSLQVTVTNPDDLNTLQGELVTQNYNLEILGLKNPADFRKFSKSLMMLDRILKETNDKVDNGLNKKLNKGTYEGDADDLKIEIDGKLPLSGGEMNGNIHNNMHSNTEGLYSFTRHAALKPETFVGGIKANWFSDTATFGIIRSGSTQLLNNCLKLKLNDVLYDVYHSGYDDSGFTTSNKTIKGAINEINSHKVSKSGDTMNGSLVISTSYQPTIRFDVGGVNKGGVYGENNALIMYNPIARTFLHMYDNGDTTLGAKNLNTNSKEVITAINELNNKCPYRVGDIYTTTNPENPSTIWLGTTWSKIEGRFLYGTSGGGSSKQTGGSNSKTISVNNLPSHTHSASTASHNHAQSEHTHTIKGYGNYRDGTGVVALIGTGASMSSSNSLTSAGGTTGNSSPATSISATGGGTPLDITPSYYTVHIWLREG